MAFNEFGQGYFIFEDIDFAGALDDLYFKIDALQNLYESYEFFCVEAQILGRKIEKYLKVSIYLLNLKRGKNYL